MMRNGHTLIKSNLEYSVGIKSKIFIVESEDDQEVPDMIFSAYDQPDDLRELLGLIQDWNRRRMKVVFDVDFDLNNKCSFYENCDFKLLKVW